MSPKYIIQIHFGQTGRLFTDRINQSSTTTNRYCPQYTNILPYQILFILNNRHPQAPQAFVPRGTISFHTIYMRKSYFYSHKSNKILSFD